MLRTEYHAKLLFKTLILKIISKLASADVVLEKQPVFMKSNRRVLFFFIF